MKPNPITQHLTRNHRWPSLWGVGLLALEISVISTAAAVSGMELVAQIGVFAAWALMLINPLVIAVLSSSLARQTSRDEHYKLLKLTPLSPAQIRQGFVRAALFRSRVQLAVQIGLLLLWVAEIFTGWYAMSTFYQPDPPQNPNIAAPLIFITLMGIGAFGLNLLAAVTGVRQGLREGHPARSIVVSLAMVLLVPALCYIPGLTLLGPAIGVLWWDVATSLQAIGLALVFFVLPSYGLAALLYWPLKKNR